MTTVETLHKNVNHNFTFKLISFSPSSIIGIVDDETICLMRLSNCHQPPHKTYDWFCVSSDHFATWPIPKLIYTFTSHLPDYPCDELDTAHLHSPENLLHCIKELSGHRLCPQTRFRSPEKSTQRDSFRLQYTYVFVSAFAFGCMCLCVLACIPVRWCVGMCMYLSVWVYSVCLCVSFFL